MRSPVVSILAIGDELISGKIADTNSAFLARELESRGLEVKRISSVGDEHEDICAELRSICARSELVVTTGGLGPTTDDLTRQAIAEVCELELREHAGARKKLEELLAARKRPVNENNLRQVILPVGAEVITNRIGTADAFVTRARVGDRLVPIVSLPGVPRELHLIFEEELAPWLTKEFSSADRRSVSVHFRCFGLSESHIGRQVESCQLPDRFDVAYRPMFPEVLVTITARGTTSPDERKRDLDAHADRIANAIGPEFVVGREAEDTLPIVLSRLLAERGLTLAAAESCSGGILADMLVSVPGSSKCFASSVVSYSNDSKCAYLGVRPAILARYGAVSAEVAGEMARGARIRSGARLGVSITGIAGPDGGTEEKPVGTFFIGLADEDGEQSFHFFFPYERNMFRRYCAALALDLIRRKVLGLRLSWERQ